MRASPADPGVRRHAGRLVEALVAGGRRLAGRVAGVQGLGQAGRRVPGTNGLRRKAAARTARHSSTPELISRTGVVSYPRSSVVTMLETPDEVVALQRLLDSSRTTATAHLRSIVNDDRTLSARDLVTLLTGMRVLSVATVTARGEPRISALDGHFLHGTWTFGTSADAAKARHMRARPAVSVAHVDNEELAVFSHGRVEVMRTTDPDWRETIGHWTAHYGSSPLEWGDEIRMYRYRPHWMVGYAADRAGLMATRVATA
jgi:general stress protein 26